MNYTESFLLFFLYTQIFLFNYPYPFLHSSNKITLSSQSPCIPSLTYSTPIYTVTYIQPNITSIHKLLSYLVLSYTLSTSHHAPPHIPYIFFPPLYVLSTCLHHQSHTLFQPKTKYSKDHCLTMSLDPTTFLIFLQIHHIHTPFIKSLYINYNSKLTTPYYSIPTHQAFNNNTFPTLTFSYPYPLPTPTHYLNSLPNLQYIYHIHLLSQTITYPLSSASFTLTYHKIFISFLKTLTQKYLVIYLTTNYLIHPYTTKCPNNHPPIKLSLSLTLFLSYQFLISPSLNMTYHALHHFYDILIQPYSLTFLYKKPHYIVPKCLFLLLGGDIESNPGPINHLLRNHPNDLKQ